MESWVGIESHLQVGGIIKLGKEKALITVRIREENLYWTLLNLCRLLLDNDESLRTRSLSEMPSYSVIVGADLEAGMIFLELLLQLLLL